ncbi:MAG: hypothetical protein HQ527_07800 [Cyanobacteria bacterium]|nr:hypothetical protein [Cyanobacteria bacterium bin.51]
MTQLLRPRAISPAGLVSEINSITTQISAINRRIDGITATINGGAAKGEMARPPEPRCGAGRSQGGNGRW